MDPSTGISGLLVLGFGADGLEDCVYDGVFECNVLFESLGTQSCFLMILTNLDFQEHVENLLLIIFMYSSK